MTLGLEPLAQGVKSLGPVLSRLFQHSFSVAKLVRKPGIPNFYLDYDAAAKANISRTDLEDRAARFLLAQPGVEGVKARRRVSEACWKDAAAAEARWIARAGKLACGAVRPASRACRSAAPARAARRAVPPVRRQPGRARCVAAGVRGRVRA